MTYKLYSLYLKRFPTDCAASLVGLKERQRALTSVKHGVGSTHISPSGTLAAAFPLFLGLSCQPQRTGQGHCADGAAGHLSAGHLLMDRWGDQAFRVAP